MKLVFWLGYLLVICFLVFFVSRAFCVQIVLGGDNYGHFVEDTFVFNRIPDRNFGDFPNIGIVNDEADECWIYIKFNEFNDIVGIDDVISAELSLYVVCATGESSVGVYAVKGAQWSEYGLTWDNKPSYYESSEVVEKLCEDFLGWVTFDVTDIVQSWVDFEYGYNGFCIRLLDGNECGFIMKSSELDEDVPVLEIEAVGGFIDEDRRTDLRGSLTHCSLKY